MERCGSSLTIEKGNRSFLREAGAFLISICCNSPQWSDKGATNDLKKLQFMNSQCKKNICTHSASSQQAFSNTLIRRASTYFSGYRPLSDFGTLKGFMSYFRIMDDCLSFLWLEWNYSAFLTFKGFPIVTGFQLSRLRRNILR
jgi:hypothetical protein